MFQNPHNKELLQELNETREQLTYNVKEVKKYIDCLLSQPEIKEGKQSGITDAYSLLRSLCYFSAVLMDETRARECYELLLSRNLLDGNQSFMDCVLGACFEQDDCVTSFKWIFRYHRYNLSFLQDSIGATLENFKTHHNIELIYTDFYLFLKAEMLPKEIETNSFVVREAIVHLLSRLLRFDELITFIESEATPTAEFQLRWLEHKYETLKDVDPGTLMEETLSRWEKLYERCVEEPEYIYRIGRLYYPMRWYMDCYKPKLIKCKRKNDDQHWIEAITLSVMFINWHITRIKEMLSIPISHPAIRKQMPHITMYMRPSKFTRVFSKCDEKEAVTWSLTCADHMNDDNEGKAFFGYLNEYGESNLSSLVKRFGILNENERSSVFLGSFSETYNDQYMYTLYGTSDEGEKGFCVDFDVSSFDDLIEDSLSYDEYYWICPLYAVVYANSVVDVPIGLRNRIKRIAKKINTIALYTGGLDESYASMVEPMYCAIYRMLEEIIYLFKYKQGPDNDTNNKVIRSWEREREIRTMKCVRGRSKRVIESEYMDSRGKPYRNYITEKKIVVKDICGGSNGEALERAKKTVKRIMQSSILQGKKAY